MATKFVLFKDEDFDEASGEPMGKCGSFTPRRTMTRSYRTSG